MLVQPFTFISVRPLPMAFTSLTSGLFERSSLLSLAYSQYTPCSLTHSERFTSVMEVLSKRTLVSSGHPERSRVFRLFLSALKPVELRTVCRVELYQSAGIDVKQLERRLHLGYVYRPYVAVGVYGERLER